MAKKSTIKKSSDKKSGGKKMPNDLVSFEKAIEELEALVEEMEQGDISLEESLKKFERGIELTRNCQKALQETEQKVQVLMENKTNDELTEFEDSGSGES